MTAQAEVLIGRVVSVVRLCRVLCIDDSAVVRVASCAGRVGATRTLAERDVVAIHARDTHVCADGDRENVIGVRSLDRR